MKSADDLASMELKQPFASTDIAANTNITNKIKNFFMTIHWHKGLLNISEFRNSRPNIRNLKKIVDLKEVNPDKTISNNFHEVADLFGIEIARNLIIKEIELVLNSQGLDIDERHLTLIADAMTNMGEIKGITRMGIIAQKASILARATFETPIKQFVNASIKGSKDNLSSVIENIILNQPVPVGTGLPGLLVKVIGKLAKKESEKVEVKQKVIDKVNE